jgi:ferric-dicitrate binding protein FerR (iron transport regulator)
MSSADSREPDALERETLLAYEAPRAPADMADRVLAGLRAARRPRPVWRRWAIAVAAVAAALSVALLLRGEGDLGSSGHRVVDARASIAIGGRAVAVAEAGSEIAWTVLADGAASVEQRSGDVFYRVTPGEAFVVAVPGASIRVLGTCFRVEVGDMRSRNKSLAAGGIGAAVTAAVLVTVYEGRVLLGNEQGEVELGPGEQGTAEVGAPPVAAAPAAGASRDASATKSALEARVRELEDKLRQAEKTLGDGKAPAGGPSVPGGEEQFAAETRDPSWAPEREERIQERLTRFLGIAPGNATVECRRTCCQIDTDAEDWPGVVQDVQSDVGLWPLAGKNGGSHGFVGGKDGKRRVITCVDPEDRWPAPPRPDRGVEREALLAAVRPAVEACMRDAKEPLDFETMLAVDPAGEIFNVASKADPLGHPAAECVEKAVLAAARFAPSTRRTGVPVRLSLEPTR